MRRRPQPNLRRGLLRAGVAVAILVIVLFVVIEVVSSLTAPPAHAPVIPPTPAALPTPPKVATPRATPHGTASVTPRPTPHTTARPGLRATPAPTAKPKRDIALGGAPLAEMRRARAATRNRWIARFVGPGDAYRGRSLIVARAAGFPRISAGRADPHVRPVWSPTQDALLYVTVRATGAIPGAAWTLHRFDLATRISRIVSTRAAMGLWPLGWRQGAILYAVSNGSDTSLYSWTAGRSRFLSILVPQVESAPSLSPDGSTVAFFTPADCSYCSLSLFDLSSLTTWFGPAGAPSEYDAAWTADGHGFATVLSGRLAVVDVASHDITTYRLPRGLAAVWPDPMQAARVTRGIRLDDQITGRSYVVTSASG